VSRTSAVNIYARRGYQTDTQLGEPADKEEPILHHTVSGGEGPKQRLQEVGMIRAVRYLTRDIGPRYPGSTQERSAARYVEKEMTSLGLQAETQKFRSPSTTAWSETLDHLLVVIGVILFPASGFASFGLIVLGFFFFLLDQYGRSPFSWLQPHRQSGNVVTRIKPYREPAKTLVIMAHVDSPRSAFYYHPLLVRLFRSFFVIDFLCQALIFMLFTVGFGGYLLKMEQSKLDLVWRAGLILVIPPAIALVSLLFKAAAGKPTPGGNENASGVALLLELARVYSRRQPYDTDLWLVATGAADASGLGARRFVRKNRQELKGAYYLILNGLGRGFPVCYRREGRLLTFRANRKLTSLAGRISEAHAHYNAGFMRNNMFLSEGFQLLSRGRKAMTISAREDSRYSRYWRWRKDDYDNLDPRSLRLSMDFVQAMVDNLDRGDLKKK
jgi:Peptidase family M28